MHRGGHIRWQSERGFTLPELMIVIVLMGIVFSIAMPSWFGLIESRRVDSATNQMAADLRLAHTKSTNQLQAWEVVVPANGSSTYTIRPAGGTGNTRTLDGAQIASATTIRFTPDGQASVTSGAGSPMTIRSSGSASKYHTIEFNTLTSRIKIVP
jgi:prepilin-type N-terminal cleavage/methylation domain-containing protein